MDPQSQNQGSFEVPAASSSANMIPLVPTNEAYPSAPETAPSPGGSMPSLSQQPQPVSSAMPPVFQQSAVPAHPVTSITPPAVAEDLDLIEKEWVDKAKAIVAQTRNDPYTQNKEMNRFKADYMQKRYGKEIKLDEK
jgi:hypothetical protein